MFLAQLRRLDIPRANDLSHKQLFQLIGAYVLISVPLMTIFPLWLTGLVVITLATKLGAIALGRQINKWVALPILLLSIGLVIVQFEQFGREYAALALLFVFASLKLLEARESRDAFLLMLIYFLLIMGALMANNSFFNFIYLVICLLINVFIQWRIDTPQKADIGWRQQGTTLLKAVIISVPFVVGLFYLFPRFQPLWSQPSRPTASTGLSDEMTPNSLTQLVQDGGLAFRVRFDDKVPESKDQYWRGPVLTQFDGKTWRRGRFIRQEAAGFQANTESEIRYTMIHDGTTNQWLVPLDLPGQIPSGARMNRLYEMIAARGSSSPKQYPMVSYLDYQLAQLSESESEYYTRIPNNLYPQTRELAAELRQAHPDALDFVNAVWQYFRDNEFYYDLAPPPGNDDMDRFLFTNRVGYCEHYASVYAFMVRSQGIPARVVTGYQGSEFNPISDEYEIRQLHAHAWTEVFIEGQGWLRVDPTAAVAPERINRSDVANSIQTTDALSAGDRLQNQSETARWLGQSLRAMNSFWLNWVINYDEDKQNSLWEKFGLSHLKYLVWLIFVAAMVPIVLLVLYYLQKRKTAQSQDTIEKLMQSFVQRLEKYGIVKAPADSPLRLVYQNADVLGESFDSALAVARCHYQLRYEPLDSEATMRQARLRRLAQAIEKFMQESDSVKQSAINKKSNN